MNTLSEEVGECIVLPYVCVGYNLLIVTSGSKKKNKEKLKNKKFLGNIGLEWLVRDLECKSVSA